ncbi:MAG: hypothetical protein ACREBU_13165, partial [Nitrososphaera sp.]
MLPPKGFNVSGFSESLVLYYLNRVRATAGQDIGTFFGQIGNGILTPVFTRQRDAINAQLGLTVALGNNADTTSSFVYEYIMHMSAWLYSGFMLGAFFNDAGPATMTF